MSKLTRSEIEKLASLSRLHLTDEELAIMTEKLNAIFGYLEVIKSANVDGVEPMSHVHGSINVMREDVPYTASSGEHLAVEELLKLAPDSSGRFIRTPLVVEG